MAAPDLVAVESFVYLPENFFFARGLFGKMGNFLAAFW
jgi:hypothetical protein